MKNNEYNIVNITNEKNNFDAEYSKVQNVEYSFQSENKNPIKDELNDNKAINDKVEDNLSKFGKEKKKTIKQKETRNIEQISSSSSGAMSSSVSSAVSSASATAAAGSVSGSIVAAVSVSIAAIGTVVGVSAVQSRETIVEYATFISCEITSNSVYFSFVMSSSLLRYEEEHIEGDRPFTDKSVLYKITDGKDFDFEEYLYNYEEIDENTFLFYSSIEGLEASTNYTLYIELEEIIYAEKETISRINLAYRAFTTLEEDYVEELSFTEVKTTSNSVSFTFEVLASEVGYDSQTGMANNVIAELSSGATTSDITFSEADATHVRGSGSFERLSSETTYTLCIYASNKFLGQIEFTTKETSPKFKFSGMDFFDIEETSISPMFYIKPSEVEDIENTDEKTITNISVMIENGNGYSEIVPTYREDYIESQSDGYLYNRVYFNDLNANTIYSISVINNTTEEIYGTIEVTTNNESRNKRRDNEIYSASMLNNCLNKAFKAAEHYQVSAITSDTKSIIAKDVSSSSHRNK